jgi:Arc/MetJ family transcription regulator
MATQRINITVDEELLAEIHNAMVVRETVSGIIRDLVKEALKAREEKTNESN